MPHYGVDIFSGAGGLSLGAEMAGITMRFAIEVNESAAKTYKRNHKHTEVLCQNIKEVDLRNHFSNNSPFIIMGGPPCQGFSLSNTRNRNMKNEKNFLFREFVRMVKELHPKWFLFENVSGIVHMNHGTVVEMIADEFKALGYSVKFSVLKASDFGVPQNRERFFLVGNSLDIDFDFPSPNDTKISVQEAIGDLPILENGDNYNELDYLMPIYEASEYARSMREKSNKSLQNFVSRNNDLAIKRYSYIPQGGNWQDIPEELMENYADKSRCHSGIYKRLRADQPSVVISNYRKSMLIHPTQNRGLSVREAARIQSFPDHFVFEGPISHIQQQIGNAVPPLLAKAVVKQILALTK